MRLLSPLHDPERSLDENEQAPMQQLANAERQRAREQRRADRQACHQFTVDILRDRFLLQLRDLQWQRTFALADWLESSSLLSQGIATRRFFLAGGSKDAAPAYHIIRSKYL